MILSLMVIAGITAVGWVLSEFTAIGRRFGMTLLVLFLGLVVTNLSGWQPDPAASGFVSGPLTSLAIVQLLLAVRLKQLWPDARRLLRPFLAALLITVGAVIGFGLLLQHQLSDQLPLLAGMYAATFTGGSLNFVSVARALNPPESLVLLATAADHVVFAIWFLLSLSTGMDRRLGVDGPAVDKHAPAESIKLPVRVLGLAWGLAVLTSGLLLTPLLQRVWPQLPGILVLTTVALLAAQLPGAASRRGSYGLGLLLIQPFFVVIGLSSPVGGLLLEGRWVLLYAALIVAAQALGLLLLQRTLRWGRTETLVASQAAIGGPSTALALACSLGRRELALPAVAIGLVGYMAGTYLGLAVSGFPAWSSLSP